MTTTARARAAAAPVFVGAITAAVLTALGTSPTLAKPAPGVSSAAPAPTRPACAASPARGRYRVTLPDHRGSRGLLLHVPPASAGARLPLIVALHGFDSSGAEMERETGLSTLADRAHFIVAYPQAKDGRWTVFSSPRSRRDLDFVRATIDYVHARYCTDASRVYAVGVSNGATAAVHVACELSDLIAAVAFVEGDYRAADPCHPDRPVSILEIHGVNDTVVPYRGYPGTDGAGSVFGFMGLWTALDRCGAAPRHTHPAPHMLELDWGCHTGTRVAHIKVLGFGHGWPGSTKAAAKPPGPASATWLLWHFFNSLHLRSDKPGEPPAS